MMRWLLWGIPAVLLLAGGGWLGMQAIAAPEPGHKLFHMGCKHHNHGPAWYAGHGRAATGGDSRFKKNETEKDE